VTNKPAQAAKFELNDVVRVRFGVKVPDFSDIPLGGWAGKITQVEEGNPPTYLIRWNQSTLSKMHPIYRKRCERDGFESEEMWLGGDDLELDLGGAPVIEQPTKIVTPPLSMEDEEDRIRVVLGLTRDDLLPSVDDTSLRKYYKHLAANLRFPFEATWERESGIGARSVKVTICSLARFEDDPCWVDDSYGIICSAKMDRVCEVPLAQVEKVKDKPNQQLVEDYRFWFWNNR
jgi:hypothetical protein